MPFIKIWIHLIFSTKNREPFIHSNLKEKLLKHIKVNALEKKIILDYINCTSDHVHLLVSLGSEQKIADTARLIKGESSHWINNNGLSKIKFEWQNEYIAVSVSESMIDKVREYIKNLEEHHRHKSFD